VHIVNNICVIMSLLCIIMKFCSVIYSIREDDKIFASKQVHDCTNIGPSDIEIFFLQYKNFMKFK